MKTPASLRERFFREGRLEDCPVFDLHGHMGPLQGARLPRCTPDAMVAAMARAGVRLAVFCHHDTLMAPDVGNAANLEVVRRFPKHFRAYCGINPNYPDEVCRDVASFDQYRDVYVGFKLLADYHRIPVNDPRNAPAWEKADAEALPVLLHTWGGSTFDGPDQVRACAVKYPNARILMGHSCHGSWAQAAALAREFPNVYCELTAVLDDRGAVEILVREAGSLKIVFGTDTPWFNHHNYIGALLGAEISDEDRRNILYRNARRLLATLVSKDVLGPDPDGTAAG